MMTLRIVPIKHSLLLRDFRSALSGTNMRLEHWIERTGRRTIKALWGALINWTLFISFLSLSTHSSSSQNIWRQNSWRKGLKMWDNFWHQINFFQSCFFRVKSKMHTGKILNIYNRVWESSRVPIKFILLDCWKI